MRLAAGLEPGLVLAVDGAAQRAQPDGLGRMLIDRLSRQLSATVQWLDGGPGTRIVLSFPTKA